VLHTYIEELLVEGESIEFYVEGTRTRHGRPLAPKAGLFSILVDAVNDGARAKCT